MGAIQKMISGLADTLALMLGAACALAALAAHGGRFSPRLDVLTHFAPFWLAGALIVLLYGLLLAPAALRSTILMLGGLGAVAAAALILPELMRPIRRPVAANAPHQLKLIQLNAWNENVDVEGTADWITRQAPDLVLVEECEAPMRAALVKRGFRYTRGMVRTGVFSRAAPAPAPFQIPDGDWRLLPSFARDSFDLPAGGFSIIATHVTWPTRSHQEAEIKALKALVDRYDKTRLILVGDFNLTPWSFNLQRIDRTFGLERRDRAMFSWPARPFMGGLLRSPVAFLPIDHIYAGSAWRTVSIERGPRLGSDHYPVVVVLALQD